MFEKKIFIDYKENGVATNATEVRLASYDGTFGVKDATGTVVVPFGETVDNPSTGRYEYTLLIDENKTYIASWRVQAQPGGPYKYAVQEFGPFDGSALHNSSTAVRGTFAQGSTGTLFLKTFNLEGVATDATDVAVTIYDSSNTIVSSGFPDIINKGYYAYDWDIPEACVPTTVAPGTYRVDWTYVFDGQSNTETQKVVVAPEQTLTNGSLYNPRLVLIRESLSYMLNKTQKIPVYRDIPQSTRDYKTFQFSFPRWNQVSGVRVYVNKQIQNDAYKIDFENGTITFDNTLTQYDTVHADYNFKWFSDEELDTFLSNALAILNLYPAVTSYKLETVPDRFLVLIRYGAAVDAIRSMLLSLMFQETQLVYGGAEAAKNVFQQLESLKKNYEETWTKALEQKKNGPYKGLTRMVVVPEYTLPGGRSRWFRMLFSSGS